MLVTNAGDAVNEGDGKLGGDREMVRVSLKSQGSGSAVCDRDSVCEGPNPA
jgi:hypothetical protein